MECVYEYTEGRLCRGVALRLLLLLMAQMDLDVGHGIFNGRHCKNHISEWLNTIKTRAFYARPFGRDGVARVSAGMNERR